jgi:hypothetical protein
VSRAWVFLTAIACTAVISTALLPATPAAAVTPPLLGVLGVTGTFFHNEQVAGVNDVTITVNWDEAEPTQGVFGTAYLQRVQSEIALARAAGLGVILDPGLHITPGWVFALAGGTRFVDQYGDVFSGSTPSGNNVANGVTDSAVRAAEGYYLSWLGTQFTPGEIIAVRQGGGPLGEIRYPGPSYNGHTNCYWAYDTSSQAGLPPTVQGWVPGTGTTAQAQTYLTAYNANLVNYAVWLNGQLGVDFNTTRLVVLPGWGERPGGAATEETSLLTANMAEFNEGLDWTDLLFALPNTAQTMAYTTYLDASTYLPTLQLEDPADYLASLTSGTQQLLGGENTGNGTMTTLRLCVKRAKALGFTMFNWMDESQLVASTRNLDPAGPTFNLLGAAMR